MNTPLTPTSQDNKFASRLRHVWHYTQRVSSQARAVTQQRAPFSDTRERRDAARRLRLRLGHFPNQRLDFRVAILLSPMCVPPPRRPRWARWLLVAGSLHTDSYDERRRRLTISGAQAARSLLALSSAVISAICC